MNMSRSKQLRAERKKLVEDAQALLTLENRTPEQDAQFDTMMNKADKLKADIDRLERADDAARELTARVERRAADRRVPGDQVREEDIALEDAFTNFIRRGMNGLTDEQRALVILRQDNNLPQSMRNALGTDPQTSGGYMVPEGFGDRIIEAQKWYGGMIDPGVPSVFDTDTGNPLPFPTDNDTTNSGALLSENTQITTQDITFGAITLNAYTYTSKLILVSLQLLNDSEFDLNPYLARKLGTRLGRAINTDLTNGNGVDRPRGVVTAATVGRTGATGQTTSVISDDLYELKHSVDPAYRRGAKWMMADGSLKVVKKLKDGVGRPLWVSGLAYREPDTLDGDPYVINNDMPAMAASANSIAYGDFTTYYYRRVKGITLLRLQERYADYLQVGFLAFQRVDGDLMDAGTHPIKLYQNSAT